jgi:hypothetical protein
MAERVFTKFDFGGFTEISRYIPVLVKIATTSCSYLIWEKIDAYTGRTVHAELHLEYGKWFKPTWYNFFLPSAQE